MKVSPVALSLLPSDSKPEVLLTDLLPKSIPDSLVKQASSGVSVFVLFFTYFTAREAKLSSNSSSISLSLHRTVRYCGRFKVPMAISVKLICNVVMFYQHYYAAGHVL